MGALKSRGDPEARGVIPPYFLFVFNALQAVQIIPFPGAGAG
jgi:hypothetical protein